MIHYVTGFLFSPDKQSVVLINKNRPEWQKGYVNGVGGKIESDEIPIDAMIREFYEETGVKIYDWRKFACINGPDYIVHFFCASSDKYLSVESKTDEEVFFYELSELPDINVISNTRWLIPMALYGSHDRCEIYYEK
jgi:8-oxo-dGTP diphosphatase